MSAQSFYEQVNKQLTKELDARVRIVLERLEFKVEDETLKQTLDSVSQERAPLSAKNEKSSKTKKVRDPNMPKRPQNAYMRYFNENRPSFVTKYPDAKTTEISKLAAEAWGKMTDKQKVKYEKAYQKEREEYIVKFSEYKKSLETTSST